jgi:hypothetical protein
MPYLFYIFWIFFKLMFEHVKYPHTSLILDLITGEAVLIKRGVFCRLKRTTYGSGWCFSW